MFYKYDVPTLKYSIYLLFVYNLKYKPDINMQTI